MPKVNTAAIPRELTAYPQWVVWRREIREGKPTKVPYSPKTGRRAAVDNPATWATFSAAVAAMDQDAFDGVGFVLTADDPFVGVDLDHCFDETGRLDPAAAYHVEGLQSYTEITPSGRGLRLFIRGKLPPGRRRLGSIEVYDQGRFLTLTGQRLAGAPATITDRTAVLDFWHADTFGATADPLPQLQPVPVGLDESAILAKACNARNAGPDFEALYYRGDVGLYGGDDSRADYHLCRHLLFWTGGDAAAADRLFRSSALMRPKWDEQRGATTYGERTMAAAFANLKAVYTHTDVHPDNNGHGPYGPSPSASPSQVQAESSPNGKTPARTPPRFRLIPADELDSRPPIKWLIDHEVAAGQFTLFYGPSGGGKSFVALDWALQIAQTQPVVYVAGEDADGYAPRKIAWCKHHGKPAGHLYFVDTPVNLFDPAAVAAFVEEVASVRPALIIFDTLARCMVGADENSAKDVGLVIDNLEAIRRATGAAVLPVHHTGKNGNGYRGSSTLLSHAYALIELTADDDLITISCDKAPKNSAKFAPRKLRLVQVQTGRQTEDGEAETSAVALPANQVYTQGPDLTTSQRRALETLAMPTFVDAGAKAETLRDMMSVPRSTIYNTLSALMRKGFVRQASKGDPYYITEQGRAAAGLLELEVQSSPNDVQWD